MKFEQLFENRKTSRTSIQCKEQNRSSIDLLLQFSGIQDHEVLTGGRVKVYKRFSLGLENRKETKNCRKQNEKSLPPMITCSGVRRFISKDKDPINVVRMLLQN